MMVMARSPRTDSAIVPAKKCCHGAPEQRSLLRMATEAPGDTGHEEWATVRAAAAGDRIAWDVLWRQHHERLLAVARLRLDPRLRGRVDAADVLQEAWIEVRDRLADYAASARPMPLPLWLRFLVGQQLLIVHRRHFTPGRDPRREEHGGAPEAGSEALARELVCSDTRPSAAAVRGERQRKIQEALDRLDSLDREVLALRHFEQLSNAECARVLGLTESGASRRYLRALERLKHVLTAGPGLRGEGES